MKVIAFFESIIIAISCFFCSIFNLPDKNVEALIENNGGFMYGICHPNEDYEKLSEAGLKWVRFDIPCPFDAKGYIEGYERTEYKAFKERCKAYTERGFKVMAVTPYPRDYINSMGFNPIEDTEKTKKLAVYLYNDLKDITGAFQITNEMGLVGFMHPLTLEQAAEYIGIQLEAISEVKDESFPIGYNSADLIQVSRELHKLMKPYLKYCDYVGIDLYTGVQGKAKAKDYSKKVQKLYRMTKKPIILEEFGFWSVGGQKSAEEKAEILGIYGYSTEAEAIGAGAEFISRLPSSFRNTLSLEHPGEEENWASLVFSQYSSHFYGETSPDTIENIPHTPEGQAQYFKSVMSELRKQKCLAGMIIYCCQDMEKCWVCGHEWCPFETKWGIFNIDGTPKPAYEAIKEFIAENP